MNTALNRKTVIANVLALFSGTTIAQFASALTLFLTARAVGVDPFGQYAACFALTKMSSILFNLGLDTWLLREGRRGHTALGRLLGSNLAIKLGLGVVWFAGIAGLARLLDPATYPPALLYLAALATFFEALLNTAVFGYNVALRNQVMAIWSIASSVLLLGATAGLIAAHRNDVILYSQVRLAIAVLAGVSSVAWMAKEIRLSAGWETVRRALREILPYASSEGLNVIYAQADITIIALLLGKTAAGIYSPASSIVRALFVVPQAVHTVMIPVLSQLIAEKSPRLKATFRGVILSLVVTGLGLSAGVALAGPLAVRLLLGPEFGATGSLLVILSAILFLKSGSFALAAMIVASGRQADRVIVQIVSAGLNVALNLLIVHTLGVAGVAWVYVLSELILLVGYGWVVQRWQVRNPEYLQAVNQQP